MNEEWINERMRNALMNDEEWSNEWMRNEVMNGWEMK